MVFGKKWLLVFTVCSLTFFAFSTSLSAQSSSALYHQLLKLRETKRVLYIAAHPDDENTRLIAYLGNSEHAQVAYLSLTRGDGGQNLIGKELGLELGMIRTQELLKARETDGGQQFFTRAIDFGYSKHPKETLNNWDKEKLLSDVVWIIRKFQPDIIINRFNREPGTTHGHHTTSALLSVEAFGEAGKSSAFPEQLSLVKPWQPKRVFWNGYNWGAPYAPRPDKLFHEFPVGDYNPLLGTTYSQIAADSRTMHKSQGFGATAQIGRGRDFIELVAGEPFDQDPFEGIVNRWTQIDNGPRIEKAISGVLEHFDFLNPSTNIPRLLEIKHLLDAVEADLPWVLEKQGQINQIIFDALGLQTEFLSNKQFAYPSAEINCALVLNNPSNIPVTLSSFEVLGKQVGIQKPLQDNEAVHLDLPLVLPDDYPLSQPYWLEEEPQNNLFTIAGQEDIGLPFNRPAVRGILYLKVGNTEMSREIPLKYQYNDPVDGEINQPFTVIPEIQLALNKENLFVLNGRPAELEVEVSFEKELVGGDLVLDGLSPQKYAVVNKAVDEGKKKTIYTVQVKGNSGLGKKKIGVKYQTVQGKVYAQGIKKISYAHIPNLTYFPASNFNLVNLELSTSRQRIGYIQGAGDDIPGVLVNLGYEVSILESASLDAASLQQFQTVILGIRALNVNTDLAHQMDELMEYVAAGGNLIVQYNTSASLLTGQLGPYPIQLSRTRVSVEDSPVQIRKGSHPILEEPNALKPEDFHGWIQERGLYFPGEWDERYKTPFIMHDPGESETQGALLLADYGQGTYAYSGISWFRLLPAGIPGAIKIFVNLIEQAHE